MRSIEGRCCTTYGCHSSNDPPPKETRASAGPGFLLRPWPSSPESLRYPSYLSKEPTMLSTRTACILTAALALCVGGMASGQAQPKVTTPPVQAQAEVAPAPQTVKSEAAEPT